MSKQPRLILYLLLAQAVFRVAFFPAFPPTKCWGHQALTELTLQVVVYCFNFLCVWVFAFMDVQATPVCVLQQIPEDPLKLELQSVVNPYVGARNLTRLFCNSSWCC